MSLAIFAMTGRLCGADPPAVVDSGADHRQPSTTGVVQIPASTRRAIASQTGRYWQILGGCVDAQDQTHVVLWTHADKQPIHLRFLGADASGQIRYDVTHTLPDGHFVLGVRAVVDQEGLGVGWIDGGEGICIARLAGRTVQVHTVLKEDDRIGTPLEFWLLRSRDGWRLVVLTQRGVFSEVEIPLRHSYKWLFNYEMTDQEPVLKGKRCVDGQWAAEQETECSAVNGEVLVWQLMSGRMPFEVLDLKDETEVLLHGEQPKLVRCGVWHDAGEMRWEPLYYCAGRVPRLVVDPAEGSVALVQEGAAMDPLRDPLWLVRRNGERSLVGTRGHFNNMLSLCKVGSSGGWAVAQRVSGGIQVIFADENSVMTGKQTLATERPDDLKVIGARDGVYVVSTCGEMCRFVKLATRRMQVTTPEPEVPVLER
jgi:hypothetical protein